MNISIFTEALQTTGLGHLGRCTALAEILVEKGEKVLLVVNADDYFPNWDFPCEVLIKNWNCETELLTYFQNFANRSKIFYIDSYLASIEIYHILKDNCTELICIDDDNRLVYPIGSTILNPGYPGLFIGYDREKYKVISGKDEALLRSPFRKVTRKYITRKTPENVLITLGGSDPNNLSKKILELLVNQFPKIIKQFVIGPGFTNVHELEKMADQNTYFYKNLNAEKMCDLMLSVDIAITAGGQTMYELNACGVPMLVIETAENQKLNIRGFVEFQGVIEIQKDKLDRIGDFL